MAYTIRHMHLHVKSLESALDFYRDLLGMRVKQTYAEGQLVFLSDGSGFDLALMQDTDPGLVASWFHFGCRLPIAKAVREAYDRFQLAGATLPKGVVMHEGGYVTFVVADPDGHHVEFYYEPALAEPMDMGSLG